MKKYIRISFLSLLLLLIANSGYGNIISTIVTYSDPLEIKTIGNYTYIYEDTSGKESITEVLGSKQFIKSNDKIPSLGITNSSFWIKFTIRNLTADNSILLNFDYPLATESKLFTISNGVIGDSVVINYNTSFYARKYKYQGYIYDLNILPGETKSFVLNIKSNIELLAPIYVGNREQINEQINK